MKRLSLAAILALGCISQPTVEGTTPSHTQVLLVAQDDVPALVPEYRWDARADQRVYTIADLGVLPRGITVEGRIFHNNQRYDVAVENADTDGDGTDDLTRITIHTQITHHPNDVREIGTIRLARFVIQDTDSDGWSNLLWVDDQHGRFGRQGVDGEYDTITRFRSDMRDVAQAHGLIQGYIRRLFE